MAPVRGPATNGSGSAQPATVELLTPADRDAHEEARRAYHADLPLANTPTIQKVIGTARLLVQLNRNQVSARRV